MELAAPVDRLFSRAAERLLNAWVRHTRKPHLEFMFAGMGRIAKSTGSVTPQHIAYAEAVMHRLNLRGRARDRAIQWFRQGRDGDADFHQLATRCNNRTAAVLSRMSLESFVGIAGAEPGAAANRTLHFLGSLIGVDPAEISQRRRTQDAEQRRVNEARQILGVDPSAPPEVQKRAYRQLASRYHPDKLAPNATLKERDYAMRRSIEVREAWETLQKVAAETSPIPAPGASTGADSH